MKVILCGMHTEQVRASFTSTLPFTQLAAFIVYVFSCSTNVANFIFCLQKESERAHTFDSYKSQKCGLGMPIVCTIIDNNTLVFTTQFFDKLNLLRYEIRRNSQKQ